MENKRKKLFVDRAVQGPLLLRFVMHWGLFWATAGAFLYFIELLIGAPHEAGRNFVTRHGPTFLAVLVLAPIFLHDLCKLTNRFAGPIVRLRRVLHDLAEGKDVAPIQFRDGDFWKEIAVDLNRVIVRVQASRNEHSADDLVQSSPSISHSDKLHA